MTQSIAPQLKQVASTFSTATVIHHNRDRAIVKAEPQKAWMKAIGQTGVEFAPTPLEVISGRIPIGLRGCLYRNGPARLQRGSRRVGHWFDGDGAVLGVRFGDRGATGTYRFVRTETYEADERSGSFTRGSFGMTPPPGTLPFQSLRKLMKNPANVSVLALDDRALALWDQGHPYSLDPDTLETLGEDSLGNLGDGEAFAGHYKRDPVTGEIFNFGVNYGLQPGLNIYRCDRAGQVRQKASLPLKWLPIVHDFILTTNYLVFIVPPICLDAMAVATYRKSFGDAFSWQPQMGAEVIVVDRHTLRVVSRELNDPLYLWHVGNGYEDADGNVVMDIIGYDDIRVNQYLKEVGLLNLKTPALGTLRKLRVDPKTACILDADEVLSVCGEFPTVSPLEVGLESRYTYFLGFRPGAEVDRDLWSTIVCFDYQTETATMAVLDPNCYAMEPIFAPDKYDPDRGWILTVVYDGNRHTSEVWVYDRDRLDEEPVCKLALPEVIPMGYHGTWQAR
mgnify:CR=1 FL=1